MDEKRESPKTIRHPKQITKGNYYFFLTAKPQLWNQISFEVIIMIFYPPWYSYCKILSWSSILVKFKVQNKNLIYNVLLSFAF